MTNKIRYFLYLAKGFTLIELLIALSILSIIIILLFNSLSSSIKTIEIVESSMTDIQEVRNFTDTISREIESTIFKPDYEKSIFRFTERDYYGMPLAEMQFLSLSTIPRGIFVIVYKTEVKNDRINILKKMYPPTSNPDDAKWEEVISNILGFSVNAYNNKGELVKNWDSSISQSIPDEIKVSLFLKADTNKKETFTISEVIKTRINKPL